MNGCGGLNEMGDVTWSVITPPKWDCGSRGCKQMLDLFGFLISKGVPLETLVFRVINRWLISSLDILDLLDHTRQPTRLRIMSNTLTSPGKLTLYISGLSIFFAMMK